MTRFVAIAIGGALLGLLVYAVLGPALARGPGTERGCPERPRLNHRCSKPMDARAFVDTIGVNTHLWYFHTSYSNYAMTKRRLRELGIRHVRDGLDPEHRQEFFDRVNDLGAAGIKSTLIACRVEPVGVRWTTYVKDAKKKVRSSLDALEGVNEPDLVAAGRADWPRSARTCQREIYRQAKGSTFGAPLRVPVVGPSIVGLSTSEGNTPLGRISDRADGATIHSYSGGRPPSSRDYITFTSQMAAARKHQFGGARAPVYATETGYHDALNTKGIHAPVSPRAASIYMPRLFLEYARAGVERTFLYELVDEHHEPTLSDVELNYGLFESDWSYKPSAVALKNTIALLDSPRKGPRKPLRYSVANTADADGTGPRGAVKHMLLQKANGSYWLALWQNSKVWDENARMDIANPSTQVRVRLDRRMRLASYHPTQGMTASNRRTTRDFRIKVGDDVLLIKMS